MTGNAITISIKLPLKIAERIPAPGNGRSGFIIQALEEKISRQESKPWTPTSVRGRRMAALIAKGQAAGVKLLNDEDFAREMAERRGGNV